MKQVDELVRKQKRFKNAPFVEPQCALIALDPHTGEIKALVGGRNYGASQLNRMLSERPPGSIFKPFVYAAAMNTAVAGGTRTLTPASIVVDEPTTFEFDGQEYAPNNFEHDFYGPVTLAQGAREIAERGHDKGRRDGGLRHGRQSRAPSGHQRGRQGDSRHGDRFV